MLTTIARFEFRYLLRNPLVWVTAAFTFVMFFLAMNVEGFELGSEGGMVMNAAYATLRNYLLLSVMYIFVTTSFVANAVIRDDETGFGPIIRSTPITKREYVFGRYLGAFAVAAFLMLFVPLGTWIGTLMPWADPATIGPNRISHHLYGYFLIALPNILVHSAVFFALATITRSMMATYLGVVGFVAAFLTLSGALDRPQLETAVAVAEPFALRAVADATRYWTIAEKNVLLPDLTGALLYNRLLWTGVALLVLGAAYALYRFADRGISRRERKKQKLEARACSCHPDRSRGISSVCTKCAPTAGGPSTALGTTRLPSPQHGSAALRALMWMRTKFEARQVIKSPAFPLLMAWGLYTTIFTLMTQRYPDYRPEYPTTLSMIPEIEDAFRVIALVVAIYYAGELVWRERDRRVHELIDASPLPSWAYVAPKTIAIGLVFVSMLAVNVLASVIVQLSLGFTDLEIGKYILWYVLPESFDLLLLAALAIFIQALSPHKAVGWGIMTLFLMWREMNKVIEHNLLIYGGLPQVPLSDLNGAAFFWKGAWTFRLYWGALALLLLVIAHLLWRRGTEIRLKPRLALAWRRLAGAPGWVAGAALLLFITTGAYAYYNTNVLNVYRTKSAADDQAAEYERRFWKYRHVPQPALEEMTLDVALYPDERRAVTKGRFLLRNVLAEPISEIHVRLMDRDDADLTAATVSGARLILNDTEFEYRIYRLDRPMQTGEERVLTFETHRQHRGFRNEQPAVRIVANGIFLSETQLMPVIGMNHWGLHKDPEVRRKYGLEGEITLPKLDDPKATARHTFGQGWTKKSDITVTTVADQTPIAPGKKVSDVTRDGRRTARFVSTAPIRPRFSVQSARYLEKHRNHRGVDLAVYYHPRHHWNVDRMLEAAAASLDYYQANFGPYQFDHFRIVEFPAYYGFAQAFAGTIPFSELIGFIVDHRKPDTLDYVAGVTAHEFAHQWWPHQVAGAETEGTLMLSETLAQYSAHMLMKSLRGEDQIRRYLQFEVDRYLSGRAWALKDEPPLIRVMGEDHISYRKGSVAFYLLTKRIGEDAVIRALRTYLGRYKFKAAPFPRSIDLVELLRAEAKTPEDQALITDLFERVTLYDLEVDQPTATRRPDGKWDVTLPVNAKKFYVTNGDEKETPLVDRIEIGLFTAEPGRDVFDQSHVLLMERHPIRTGRQVLKFVSEKKPLFAGVDPYNFYIDRDSADNVAAVN
jgi:ABC-2 type transport system permease protein